MGAYRLKQSGAVPDELSLIRDCRSYTLYQRGPAWYVNFRHQGRQYRLSLGACDFEQARAIVESHRDNRSKLPQLYSDKHLYKMIERARYRNRNKGIPCEIGIEDLRALVASSGGRCQVTGRQLEDSGPFRPSLDRIDPAKGYVPGNVRIVCLVTNTAMLHYGEAAFAEIAIAYCRRIGVLAEPEQQPAPSPSKRPL